jgi:hypothetical protein
MRQVKGTGLYTAKAKKREMVWEELQSFALMQLGG